MSLSHPDERPLAHMAAAPHHIRSSPPIQPGEQHHTAKLPSFSEFLYTTRAETPPRTPTNWNLSVNNSPRSRPVFDEIAWDEKNKRRRTDTLGDAFTGTSGTANHPVADSRRLSSAIDPSLGGSYGSPRHAQHATMHSAAPSHSYLPSHSIRPQSSPHPPSHALYSQPAPRHSLPSQTPFHPHPPPLQQEVYEHRQSYYAPDSQADHAFRGPIYPGAVHPGYETAYGEFRFQPHMGNDHSTFNRKRRGNLPKEATNILKEWFESNRASPYPTEDQKIALCHRCNLSLNQVSNWFINARRRAPQKEQREQRERQASLHSIRSG